MERQVEEPMRAIQVMKDADAVEVKRPTLATK